MFKNSSEQFKGVEKKSEIIGTESFAFDEKGKTGKWMKLEKGGRLVEGALYLPKEPNGETIIFIPGCPGDSVGWFENQDMETLLEDGYKVFVTRHGGVKVNGYTEGAVNNQKRSDMSDHVGKQEMSIDDWLKEPEIAIEYFAGDKVTVVSHSLGGLTTGSSLIELSRQGKANHVSKWVNLAGVTYDHETFKEKTEKIWRDFANGYLHECCEFSDGDKVVADIEAAIQKLNDQLAQVKLPDNLRTISINPKNDEYIPVESRGNIHDKLKGGLSVVDETLTEEFLADARTKNEWAMVHDFLNLTPGTLHRLIKMKVSEHRHDVKFSKPNGKEK